ncbi:alpha-mannosidase 2C1-like isoform X3 [Mya arenaria]|nr:alpha-mannosidase 2C1-like isoform X3 [Mya arenaria]
MEQGVLKHRRTTLERAEKFISTIYFTDVNLQGKLYPKKADVKSLTHWAAPNLKDEHLRFEKVVKQKFTPVKVGQQFGPTWATHWFRVDVEVPVEWVGSEVHLRWNSGSEALVYVEGKPRQGLCSEYDRLDYPLSESLQADNRSFTVYIEMACNGMFGAGDNGMIAPPDLNRQFTLSCCEVAVFDRRVYNLIREVELLHDMAKHLPEGSERGYQALYTVNAMINACDVNDPTTFQKCHEISSKFLQQKNGDSQHTTYAMGHAHIDTAWLWPYSETRRKCARSWSCTIRLMEKYPEFTFTCSQAQQLDWLRRDYYDLWCEIKKYAKEGRFIPVGGTWVEMDGLIPGGEACIRQFLLGQNFFAQEFGAPCKEFWLPDTFGYSGQLPQIMRHCGISRFLTQKLSWNLVNKFPHHTFWWEGISGHRVLAHFPPGNDYGMKGKVEEVGLIMLLRSSQNFKDKGRSDKSAFLFGFGDGGNGPSEDMVERLNKMKDIDGLPRVKMSTPDEFFSAVEEEDGGNLCRWTGELYLEMHNGTYTTHARVKKMNRLCEMLLHDVEFVHTVAFIELIAHVYPYGQLPKLWKLLLLNQFHDVLPGSSIGMVYKDAHEHYEEIMTQGNEILAKGFRDVVRKGNFLFPKPGQTKCIIRNNLSFDRTEVIVIETEPSGSGPAKKPAKKRQKRSPQKQAKAQQYNSEGHALYCVNIGSYGYSFLDPVTSIQPAEVQEQDGMYVMKNSLLEAHIDQQGRVVHMYLAGSDRDAVDKEYPANQFVMYDDIPLYWDAWDVMDYHMETRKAVTDVISETEVLDQGPLRVSLKFSLRISDKSRINQQIILDAGSPFLRFNTEVEWYENRRMLKVEFPTSVHAREATYDIQFGHIRRPNHRNTSWDTARFEVCGHKWSDLSEHGFGVAVLNDCKYGHSALDNVLRMSLLRSPKAPDRMADMETHTFSYALMPHAGTLQEADVNKHAYCLNSPLYTVKIECDLDLPPSTSFFSMSTTQVVLETIKLSQADRGVIVRFYEAHGGTCRATMTTSLRRQITNAVLVDGLELKLKGEEDQVDLTHTENSITFTIKPFQIIAVKLIGF